MRALLTALLAGLILVTSGAAAPRPADPEDALVPELVVQARVAGPAWWRVSRGGSVVWVLGVPSALPRGMKWDASTLQFRMTGARKLIMPVTVSANVGDIFLFFRLRSKLSSKPPFPPTLPPDLRGRYLAAVTALRQKPEHYGGWQPMIAGLLMVNDFRKQAQLEPSEPERTVRSIAQRKGVRIEPAATYPAGPLSKALVADISPAVNMNCLSDGLTEIEAGAGRVRTAAAAWARGDVKTALTAERGYERCLASFPDVAALTRRSAVDEAAAIAKALQTPGVTIAVLPLRALVTQDGLLARLRAQGYLVQTPATD